MQGKGNGFFCFTLGVVVGAGAYALVKSGMARKAAVAVVSKGLDLKERVAEMADRVKESAEDVVAEAQYVSSKKSDA